MGEQEKAGNRTGAMRSDAGDVHPAHAYLHEHEHGRVDDDEGDVDFSRLVGEIAGIVELVERHEPAERRAVFDAYVTAVTEFGATAAALATVELSDARTGADDDGDETDGAPGASSTVPRSKRRTAPRGALTSASQGRSGITVGDGADFTAPADTAVANEAGADADDATDGTDAGPRARRRGIGD